MYQAFTLELRKMLAYRLDFWITFFGTVVVQFLVAYCLWSVVFSSQGLQEIQGYSFPALLLYYLLVPLLERIFCLHSWDIISTEIYDGSLSRYLVYPVSPFLYKLSLRLAAVLIGTMQTVLVLWVYQAFQHEKLLSLPWVLLGLGVAWISSYLVFTFMFLIDLIAFWAENVWNVQVMLRLTMQIAGGALLPLTLFPQAVRDFLMLTPFPYIYSFPAEVFLGRISLDQLPRVLSIQCFWAVFLTFCCFVVFRRGLRSFTGVGI